ncbi:ATP synthase F1 subunit epsilon [candidate division KSB1 bacterium]|nr:ATP synthase F1 subunit epsilon [candidate division KSB1 bacterium]
MKENKFKIEIITPERVISIDGVYHVSALSTGGYFGLKARHAPFLTLLKTGIIEIRCDKGMQRYAASRGYCEVAKDKVIFLVESVEAVEEIDLERAEKACERALERLKQKQSGLDFARAQ